MDLKSMLNDSHAQRGPPPRLSTHTPQSSYDAHLDHTPSSSDVSIIAATKPTPYGPPSQAGDPRAQGGSSGGGSYFTMQSPHPNPSASASTPSGGGPPSAYAQSPGSYGGQGPYTPRDTASLPPSHAAAAAAAAPHSAPFVSPSPSIHQPPTPGSVRHTSYPPANSHAHQSNNGYPSNYHQFQSPPPPQANGLPPSQARQISPTSQYQSQPATPLGPPINYPRASPQSYRPPSQGHTSYPDHHLRRTSQSSVGSLTGRDPSRAEYSQPPPSDPGRRESIQSPYPYTLLHERGRSESVSPKTIPRPAPSRGYSTSSSTLSHATPSLPPQQPHAPVSHQNSLNSQHHVEPSPTPQMAPANSVSSVPDRTCATDHMVQQQSPAPVGAQPPSYDGASLPVAVPRDATPVKTEPLATSLKRRVSTMSETHAPPPQKRPRHEKPVWAMSARTSKDGRIRPLNFIDPPPRHNRPRPDHHQQHQQQQQQHQHQHQHQQHQQHQQKPSQPAPAHRPNGSAPPPPAGQSRQPGRWEPTIAGIEPFESLTRNISEWIIYYIADYRPPPGSQYEIEAKIGQIVDKQTKVRVFLPWIESEVMLNTSAKDGGLDTKFESNMTRSHHKALNEYLNGLVQQNVQDLQVDPTKERLGYNHPKENDEFFVLSELGKQHLDPALRKWIDQHPRKEFRDRFAARNEFKVRKTVDKVTGKPVAQIIKIRIADKDIYNPSFDFDYRISISLEIPWQGAPEHLIQEARTRGRNKDRMSYRHMMYQVDLTQVSHADNPQQFEHELEVELSTEWVRQDLEDMMAGRPSDYQLRIRGLIDNARLLSRKGTIPMGRPEQT